MRVLMWLIVGVYSLCDAALAWCVAMDALIREVRYGIEALKWFAGRITAWMVHAIVESFS